MFQNNLLQFINIKAQTIKLLLTGWWWYSADFPYENDKNIKLFAKSFFNEMG